MDGSLVEEIHHFLQTQRVGVLATSSAGHPYTTLVAFTEVDDLRQILFATHRSTRKFANLTGDNRVSLLIDNRTNQPEDFRRAKALTAFGTAKEIPSEERRLLEEHFLKKHPYLMDFVRSPGCALCRISVQKYGFVHRFQDVVELRIDEAVSAP